jgi:Tol biopolymer transport system component
MTGGVQRAGRRARHGSGIRSLFFVVIAAAGLAASGAAQAQYFGQNKVQYRTYDWHSIRSDHFQVYFYPELDSLARRVLDLAEKTDRVLTRTMGHSLRRPIPIILYGSHNDFAQTNVTPELIDTGTGGFTEVLRNRVVLPFTGSYEDLRHVVVHELVHAYMFDLLYAGSAASLIARQGFYAPPLWFAEGLAEHVSLGMEPNAEMFLRDGTIDGYLPPLPYSGGYIVYKQGQSAVGYLVERYGEDRLRDLLQRLHTMRNFDRAFQRSIGTTVGKFDEQWRIWLKKRYWPTIAHKEDPEFFARRLTDHRRDQSNLNTAPAVSPHGDRVAYISDRKQYTDVYVMSAFDGKQIRRLIRGERNTHFESIPSFRSAISWSPDGQKLAMAAKSRGRDVLYVVSVENGKVLRRFDLDCVSLAYPAWSPVSDSIAVVGVRAGRSDLWVLDAGTGATIRLTDDTHDEKEPSWSPDGAALTFSSDRLAPVVLHPVRAKSGFGAYAIFHMDLGTRAVEKLFDTPGDDHSPAWSVDGKKLAFVSDRSGTPNIYLYDRNDGSFTQLTDVEGGVTSLSWSREGDRLVFSAFDRGGFDVFIVREALSLDPVLERLRRRSPQSVIAADRIQEAPPDTVPAAPPSQGALARSWPDSLSAPPDTTAARAAFAAAVERDSVALFSQRSRDPDAPWYGGPGMAPLPGDTLGPLPVRSPLVERGGPFAVSDSVLSQAPARYRARLAPDYAGAGFYASNLGVIGASQFLFSDFLGNHNLFISTDVFSNNLSETNALVAYSYLPRRMDLSTAIFHFKNYFSSDVTTLGEQLGTPRLFSERSFGGQVSASYPFDRFRRVEIGLIQMFVERTFFEEDEFEIRETGREYRSVSAPTMSWVGDNTLFGYYGPVNGSRYNVSFTPSFAWFDNGLAYRTLTLDTRKYWDLTHGYTFAVRALGGVSEGRDPQSFQVGGFSTVRGYPDFDTHGSRVAILNLESRFPFIQQLGLVGPVPLGIFNLRGAAFTDFGLAWNEGESPRLVGRSPNGGRRLQDLMMGFGVGARTAVAFFLLKLDVAWNTDFRDVSQPRWHFSIGPEF